MDFWFCQQNTMIVQDEERWPGAQWDRGSDCWRLRVRRWAGCGQALTGLWYCCSYWKRGGTQRIGVNFNHQPQPNKNYPRIGNRYVLLCYIILIPGWWKPLRAELPPVRVRSVWDAEDDQPRDGPDRGDPEGVQRGRDQPRGYWKQANSNLLEDTINLSIQSDMIDSRSPNICLSIRQTVLYLDLVGSKSLVILWLS